MMAKHLLCVLGFALLGGTALAQDVPRTVRPESLQRTHSQTGAAVAYIVGSAKAPGLYVISAFYPAGTRGTPHTHPDARVTTVIAGTLYAGSGTIFDEAKVQVLPPGSVLMTPAGSPHWAWAKDGDVLVQEVGVGPTANDFPAGK